MAMKRCPDCGEKYSDTYKYCPFCEEEEILRDGGEPVGRRARQGGISPVTLILLVLILVMGSLLAYLLKSDKQAQEPQGPITPPSNVTLPAEPDAGDDNLTDPAEDPAEDPGEDPAEMPDEPDTSTTTPAAGMNYEKAMALPDGLTLSSTDFTLRSSGESAKLRVSGGSGTYTWFSEDDGVASVDAGGTVTAISRGTITVVVTDGSKKAACTVRCNLSGTSSSSGSSSNNSSSSGSDLTISVGGGSTSSTSGGSLKTGSGKVANADTGVYVRSQPNTNCEKIATLTTGNEVKIVADAGNGWYEITFIGSGGVTTSGYMKGDYLSN